jgi:hypothetical protein
MHVNEATDIQRRVVGDALVTHVPDGRFAGKGAGNQ